MSDDHRSVPFVAYAALAVAAILPRLGIAFYAPQAFGDAHVYLTVAANIFENLCVSLSDPASGACVPHWGGNQPPGYPLFIALVWSLFGHSLGAIRVVQTLLAVAAICWMVRAVNIYTGSARTALAVGVVLAFSPIEVAWPRHVFTESLALAATIWVFAELILSLAQGRLRRWSLAMALVGAIFLRYDNAMLCVPTALCGFLLHRPWEALRRGAILAVIVALPYGVWTARHVAVGLSPIPDYSVMADGSRPPFGYLAWGATWSVHAYQVADWAFPAYRRKYSKIKVDPAAYGDAAERQRVEALLSEAADYDGEPLPQPIDDAFAELAREKRARDPVRFWLWNPLERAALMWVNPYSSMGWPIVSELPFRVTSKDLDELVDRGLLAVIGFFWKHPEVVLYKGVTTAYRWGLLAISICCLVFSHHHRLATVRRIIWLAALYAVLRTAVFSFTFATDIRYLVEAMPALETAAVLAAAALLLGRRGRRFQPLTTG